MLQKAEILQYIMQNIKDKNDMIELSLLIQIIIELVEWHKELKLLEQQNGHIIHLDQ